MLYFASRHFSVLFAIAALGSSAACSDKSAPSLGWSIEFVCDSDREAADTLSLAVRNGDCGGDAVYAVTLARGDKPKAGNAISPGTYGLTAIASASTTGETIAQGCVVATLPAEVEPVIRLASEACEAAGEDAGEANDADLDADTMDAEEPDAGDVHAGDVDASEIDADAEDADAEDAGPPPMCPPDCADSDPCTDDHCENGICVHDPFTGVRECDRVACTTGDQCAYGVCMPGTPTNSLCMDDGNPCTLETCVAATGCDRSPADSGSCSDGISCTGTDTCRAGICRGVDACPNGVCSAGQDMCISGGCGGDVDCDDHDPCTVDVCNTGNGTCLHNPASGAACDDGLGCTAPDTCNAGVCMGTSTCPATATCAGSTCVCPGSTSLCGNACLNLSTTTAHCGTCDRDCGAAKSCQNGACRPSASGAAPCTAQRFGGHDYLFCTDGRAWDSARDKCRGFGYGLVIIDSATENTFVQSNLANADSWIGANDMGNDGNNCKLASGTTGEGHWYWASATQATNAGTPLCTYATTAPAGCVVASGAYQNWSTGEPNNNGCGCFGVCLPAEDSAFMKASDGKWNDDGYLSTRNYVCETP